MSQLKFAFVKEVAEEEEEKKIAATDILLLF